MVPIFSCYPSGSILLRTKAICLKRKSRLISISVNYMLGKTIHFIQNYIRTLSAVRRMCSSMVSMMQSILEFRIMHAIPHSYISVYLISVLHFSAKSAFVTAYLLESSLAQFKNVVCCFQTISCVPSFKEGNTVGLTETANKLSQSLRGLIH